MGSREARFCGAFLSFLIILPLSPVIAMPYLDVLPPSPENNQFSDTFFVQAEASGGTPCGGQFTGCSMGYSGVFIDGQCYDFIPLTLSFDASNLSEGPHSYFARASFGLDIYGNPVPCSTNDWFSVVRPLDSETRTFIYAKSANNPQPAPEAPLNAPCFFKAYFDLFAGNQDCPGFCQGFCVQQHGPGTQGAGTAGSDYGTCICHCFDYSGYNTCGTGFLPAYSSPPEEFSGCQDSFVEVVENNYDGVFKRFRFVDSGCFLDQFCSNVVCPDNDGDTYLAAEAQVFTGMGIDSIGFGTQNWAFAQPDLGECSQIASSEEAI